MGSQPEAKGNPRFRSPSFNHFWSTWAQGLLECGKNYSILSTIIRLLRWRKQRQHIWKKVVKKSIRSSPRMPGSCKFMFQMNLKVQPLTEVWSCWHRGQQHMVYSYSTDLIWSLFKLFVCLKTGFMQPEKMMANIYSDLRGRTVNIVMPNGPIIFSRLWRYPNKTMNHRSGVDYEAVHYFSRRMNFTFRSECSMNVAIYWQHLQTLMPPSPD